MSTDHAKKAYIDEQNKVIKEAVKKAKAKSDRLNLLKSRHEHYLAEQREYMDPVEEDQTEELRWGR